MTDWIDDLRRLADLVDRPEKYDSKAGGSIVVRFLYHVIPHLRAAGRLLLDYEPEDIFAKLDYKPLSLKKLTATAAARNASSKRR